MALRKSHIFIASDVRRSARAQRSSSPGSRGFDAWAEVLDGVSTEAEEPFSHGLATFKLSRLPACLCDLNVFFTYKPSSLLLVRCPRAGTDWDTASQQLLGNISSSVAKRQTTVPLLTSPLPDTVSALAVQQFLALRQYWRQRIQKRIRDTYDSPKYPKP